MPRRIKPTVVIGIGGTGLRTAMYLKRALLDRLGLNELPNIVRILVFDADDERRKLRDIKYRNGESVELMDRGEFIRLSCDIPALVRTLDQRSRPSITNWFPPNHLAQLSRRIRGGEAGIRGRVRKIGRLYLFHNLLEVQRAINRAANAVVTRENRIAVRDQGFEVPLLENEEVINFFFVCSTCGGTGSGVSLDLAFLCRGHIRPADQHPNDRYWGFLVMPGAWEGEASTEDLLQLKANTYAYWKELDYFNHDESRFVCTYGPGIEVDTDLRPFDYICLVDAEDQLGRRVQGVNKLTQAISNAIFLSICDPVDAQMQSVLAASPPCLFNSIDGRKTAYTGIGLSVLREPIEELKTYCRSRLATEVLSFLLGLDMEGELADPYRREAAEERKRTRIRAVNDGFHGQHGTVDNWAEDLALDPVSKAPLGPNFPLARFQRLTGDSLLNELRQAQTNLENRDLPHWKTVMDGNERQVRDRVLGNIQGTVYDLLDDPEQDLFLAIEFLRALDETVDKGRQSAQEDKPRAQAAIDEARQNPALNLQAVERESGRFSGNRQATVGGFLSALTALSKAQVGHYRAEKALGLLASLKDDVRAIRQRLEGLKTKLRALHEAYEQELKKSLPQADPQKVFEIDILKKEHFCSTYEELAPDVRHLYRQFRTTLRIPVSRWAQETDGVIKGPLAHFSEEPFRGLDDSTLEESIRRTKQDPVQLRQELEAAATLLLKYIEAELRAEDLTEPLPQAVRVLGVAQPEGSILVNALPDEVNRVSTGDSHEAILYVQEHGFTIASLAAAVGIKKGYQDAGKSSFFGIPRSELLHLQPGFEFFPDPLRGRPTREDFARAIAFDLISLDRGAVFLSSGDGSSKRIGGSLEEAYRKVAAEPHLLKELRERLDNLPNGLPADKRAAGIMRLTERAEPPTPLEQVLVDVLQDPEL